MKVSDKIRNMALVEPPKNLIHDVVHNSISISMILAIKEIEEIIDDEIWDVAMGEWWAISVCNQPKNQRVLRGML